MREPAIVDLYVPQGDTFTQEFRLLEGGVAVDLAGATVAAEVRHSRYAISVPLATTVGPAAGEITLTWGPTKPPYGHYRYDVEVTKTGVVRTWIKGRFHVERDVTRPVATGVDWGTPEATGLVNWLDPEFQVFDAGNFPGAVYPLGTMLEVRVNTTVVGRYTVANPSFMAPGELAYTDHDTVTIHATDMALVDHTAFLAPLHNQSVTVDWRTL